VHFAAEARQISRMAAVPAMDGLAQRVTNRTRCFNSCWLDSNVETARISTHHLRDAAVRDQDEFMHVLLYVASLIATLEARSQPSTQSAEEPNRSTHPFAGRHFGHGRHRQLPSQPLHEQIPADAVVPPRRRSPAPGPRRRLQRQARLRGRIAVRYRSRLQPGYGCLTPIF
jgi:hypothetical protein